MAHETGVERTGGGPPWWAVAFPVLALVLSGVMIAVGVATREGGAGAAVAAAGALGVILTIALLPLVIASARRAANPAEGLTALRDAIERVAEQQALSDDARRVIHRRRERELLRRAIEEDIAAQDWDAAMVLVGELADRFGYRADAEEFRERVEQARADTQRRQVEEGIGRIDAFIVQRRWDQATVEAARVGRLYPDSPRVPALGRRVDVARNVYKEDLERRFLESAQHDRVDEAMALMKELDSYLSDTEAEPFREVARGVIGKARDNLGAQFKLAVQDRDWDRAAAVGARIIREFPNSRMASEVRELLDTIRARAAGAPAKATV